MDVIEGEYEAMSKKIPSDYTLKQDEHTLHGGGSWNWHSLVTKGKLQPSFQLLAPRTAALCQGNTDLLTGPPFAYSFFSSLGPGTHIAPHFGPCNIRLRVHLPLRVPQFVKTAASDQTPPPLGMRIGGGERSLSWERGKPIVFDDTYEHEVWNKTTETRVVLLVDLWHPELSLEEREAINGMFDEARAKGWLS